MTTFEPWQVRARLIDTTMHSDSIIERQDADETLSYITFLEERIATLEEAYVQAVGHTYD